MKGHAETLFAATIAVAITAQKRERVMSGRNGA
jgi:hypothetical protein